MYKETNKKQTKGDEKGVRGETEVIANNQTIKQTNKQINKQTGNVKPR